MKYEARNMKHGQILRPGSRLRFSSYGGQAGQAAISLIFLIGGTILLIGITLAFLIFSFITSSFGFKAANEALALALSGTNDAIFRISKNKNYPLVGCDDYGLEIDGSTVSVRVQRSWGDPAFPEDLTCLDDGFKSPPPVGLATIESKTTVFGRIRKVFAVVSISQTGQVSVVSIKQEILSSGGGGNKN